MDLMRLQSEIDLTGRISEWATRQLIAEVERLQKESATYLGASQDAFEEIEKLKGENKKLCAALDPVRDWFDGDARNTDVAQMLTEAIIQLPIDRKELLRLSGEERNLREALETIARGRSKGQHVGPMHEHNYRAVAIEALKGGE